MTIETKRIELNSVENIALAERMVERGWRIVRSTLFAVYLERRTEKGCCG